MADSLEEEIEEHSFLCSKTFKNLTNKKTTL